MRTIDMDTWPRLAHFSIYKSWGNPHFNMCANVDITEFYRWVKERNVSITVAIVYAIARTANDITEFRYRIRGNQVVEHEIIHPSTTILKEDDLFTFCTFDYCEDFSMFAAAAKEQIRYVKGHPSIPKEARDDMLYMTSIPWVSFTSFKHPMNVGNVDSIPRFAWGKFFSEVDRLKMPLSVQGHHAVMDGLHIGRFYDNLQSFLYHPESILVR